MSKPTCKPEEQSSWDGFVCPHCNYCNEDSWELLMNAGDGDEFDLECGNCGEPYHGSIDIRVTYNSRPHSGQPAEEEE